MTDPPKKALTLEELNACEPTQNGPDGMVTDEHLRWQAQIIMQAQIDAILGRRELPKGVNLSQTKDLLETQAKLNKKDLKRLLDNRTEAQKYEDATKELIETPLSIFEAVDGQLDEMERQVAFVNKYATDKWGASNQALRDARLAKKEQDRIEASKKAWGERIRRLKNLREQARNPFPKGSAPGNKPAIASVHLLRFMVYVGRTEDGHIYSMAEHHCQMAMALYEAEFRRMWSKDKLEWMDVKFTGFLGVMPPGHGKPLDVDTKITMADGTYRRLGDIRVGDRVIGHSGNPRTVTEVHEQGILPCLKITTHGGREIVSAYDHPFLTADGWKEAKDLLPKDVLALAHNYKCEGTESDIAQCRLAGYFVGDGSCSTNGTSVASTIHNADPEIIESICASADTLGFETAVRDTRSKCKTISIKGGARSWLRQVELAGKTAHTKRVPPFVMKSCNAGVAAFIAAYFECDGCVTKKGQAREDCCIQFSSVSSGLLEDVRSLLIRLGIQSRIRSKTTTCQTGAVCNSFVLEMTSVHETAKFTAAIPVIGPKAERLKGWGPRKTRFDGPYLPDPIVSIETHEDSPCRCLTVETDHTFLANDTVVHNTVLATHWCGLRIAENPKIRGLMGHAQAGMAEQNLQFVTAMVDPETAQGRRLRSLYPDVPPIRKKTTDTLDLETSDGEKKKAPTLMAYGVTAKISGSDADFILFDDICDQEIAEQETTRKRVFDRMNGTWRRRLREKPTGDGHWPFEVTIGTLWHHDDPNARRIEMAKNKSIKLRVKVLKCGGPDDGFKPVWPEVYGSAKLKSIYTEMRNPHLYAAQYQANPLPLELRKIKRLAYYLPGDKAHADFLQTSINHVTIDPAGTNHAKSDKSSYVYGACGDLITKRTDGSVEYVRRLRIVDGRELTANQSEIVQHVCAFAEMNSTHYIHCEMVGGYEAMRDFFEARDLDVIAHQPHGKGKDVRLGHVSSMLDDSLRDRGFPGAVVEFPGMIRPDGTLGPDPESPLAWLEDQILNFGVAKGDHGVDALVYLCKHLGPELSVADGAVTKTLQINRNLHADPRINRMLDYFARDQDTRKTAGQEENDFMAGSEQEMW